MNVGMYILVSSVIIVVEQSIYFTYQKTIIRAVWLGGESLSSLLWLGILNQDEIGRGRQTIMDFFQKGGV